MDRVIIIGGGAAGSLAAIFAARNGREVYLLEKNDKIGKKLYITGKGRCNLTNAGDMEDLFAAVSTNRKFLYSAFYGFTNWQVMGFFEELGVGLKTERGNRVFPASDHSSDIIRAMQKEMERQNIHVRFRTAVKEVLVENGKFCGVRLANKEVLTGNACIVATGGLSYPSTGSTGDGYRLAQSVGHSIVEPRACLVPLEEAGESCARMQGLSLRNVSLTVKNQKKKVLFREQGELLFTHFGLSGPLVLSASAHIDWRKDRCTALIDLKPALEEAKLEERVLRDIAAAPNKAFHNLLEGLLPRLMVPVMVERVEVPADLPVNSLTRGQRRRLVETMKGFVIPLAGPRPVKEAIITAGGVKTGEVDPKTMASKLVPGLYFAGEVLDIDARTGGFNLQLAFSTGYAAAMGL